MPSSFITQHAEALGAHGVCIAARMASEARPHLWRTLLSRSGNCRDPPERSEASAAEPACPLGEADPVQPPRYALDGALRQARSQRHPADAVYKNTCAVICVINLLSGFFIERCGVKGTVVDGRRRRLDL